VKSQRIFELISFSYSIMTSNNVPQPLFTSASQSNQVRVPEIVMSLMLMMMMMMMVLYSKKCIYTSNTSNKTETRGRGGREPFAFVLQELVRRNHFLSLTVPSYSFTDSTSFFLLLLFFFLRLFSSSLEYILDHLYECEMDEKNK